MPRPIPALAALAVWLVVTLTAGNLLVGLAACYATYQMAAGRRQQRDHQWTRDMAALADLTRR